MSERREVLPDEEEYNEDIVEPGEELDEYQQSYQEAQADEYDDKEAVSEVQKHRLALLRRDAPLDKVQLKLMDDIAKTAQGNLRIKTDESNAESNETLAKAFATMAKTHVTNQAPKRDKPNKDAVTSIDDLVDDSEFEIAEDELSTENRQYDIDEIQGGDK